MIYEFSLFTASIILCVLFGAALVKGITGLGFATSAIPMLALFLGVKAAIPLVLIPSLASNLILMRRAGDLPSVARQFRWLYGGAILGVVGGLLLLTHITGGTAEVILGGVLLLYCLYAWAQPDAQMPPHPEQPTGAAVGLLTGLVNGLTGAQTIPLVPYLLSLNLTPSRIVQASNISFSLSSITMLIGVGAVGWLTSGTLFLSAIGLIPTYLGVMLGSRIRDRLNPRAFKRLVILVLGASGLSLILKTFLP